MPDGNKRQDGGSEGRTTRRTVLKLGAAAGVAPALPWTVRRARAQNGATKLEEPDSVLSKFVNELPNPLDDAFLMNPNPSGRAYDVSMVETTHNFDPGKWNNQTRVFVYKDNNDDSAFGGGTFPGKTFEVQSGESAAVKYTNELHGGHFLPIDTTVHGASDVDNDGPRTVTHMHGGKTQPPSDGDPEDTRTPGKPQVMHYSNINPASTLWYHDHALGITRLNVYAGLAGFYIVRDEDEADLIEEGLPSGEYEIPIVLQDRCFDTDGNLFYPYQGEDVDENPIGTSSEPRVPLEFFGNVSVVNGLVWPKATVEARKYRIRLLNGSNSRFYRLKLQFKAGDSNLGTPTVTQIGTDGGFLFEGPNQISGRIHLAPGERMDLVVDFEGLAGNKYLLHNNAGSPFKGDNDDSDSDDAGPLPELMVFDVDPFEGEDSGSIPPLPESFPGLSDLEPDDAVNTRHLTLVEGTETIPETGGGGTVDRLQPSLGVVPPGLTAGYRDISEFEAEGLKWDDPNTEDPKVNDAEVWNVYNLTEDTHPIHLHIVQFKVHERRMLDIQETGTRQVRIGSDGLPATTGGSLADDPTEQGPKDTVRVNPGECVSIVVPFDTFPGETVWHCHILEHEDNEMMRPMKVGGKAK